MHKAIISMALCAMVTGCSSTPPLYFYGDYNKAVYSYFNGAEVTPQEQIQALESTIQQAAARQQAIAPGVHAQLGMLYFETGNADRGTAELLQEKSLFPESAHYIDFLLHNHQGDAP